MDRNASRLRAGKEETPNISMLEQLPLGPLSEITSYLNQNELSAARKSSLGLAGLFKNDLEQAKAITFVLQGKEEAALALLEQSPELLLIKKKSVDYSRRSYYNTPFQAAFLSHDDILCEKMRPLFDKLPDGKAILVKQLDELFPKGIPEQTAYDLSSITQVINDSFDEDIKAVFNKQENDTPIYKKITSFREQFTAVSLEEKFFNPEHLINAYIIFDQHYDNWRSPQRQAFFSLIIGYMQRFLPAFYAQAYCQGLLNVNLEEKNFKRSLKLEDGSLMLPLADGSGLGFTHGIYLWHGFAVAAASATRARVCAVPLGGRCLKDFVEQIRQTYLAYGVDFQTPERPSANKTP